MRLRAPQDVASAAVLVGLGSLEVVVGTREAADPVAALVFVLVGAAALLVRSRWPRLSLAVLVGIVASDPWIGPGVTASLVLAMLFALGTVARRCAERVSTPAAVAALGLLAGTAALSPVPTDAVVLLLGGGAAWAAGRLLRRDGERAARLITIMDELEAERDARAKEAVSAERTRIARELHDAVAHTVSVMTLQAGAVRRRIEQDSGRVPERDVLLEIERLGRDAVEELHQAVGVLRADTAATAPLAPQPRLVDVDELAQRLGAAGLPVEVHVNGRRRPLPAGVEFAAYRVIQEALTNSLKHAGPARAWVEIHYGADQVTLSVTDDGRGGEPERVGHGLVGMRERVAQFGGVVDAAQRPTRGFAVTATLPLRSAP
jgi:signal transduction histidine kinase